MSERPILFVGDLHLGRRPLGLTQALEAADLTPRQLSPVVAWQRAVEHALTTRARAVVLAGDVVDRAKDRFEAYAPLEAGARALTDARIPVYAVAGNHDSLVLPRLAQQVPGVTLLGAGGQWELVRLPSPGPSPATDPDDEPPVDLLGWSFPQPHVIQDPTLLPSFRQALGQRRPNAVTLGVVHGDLGATASHYAPLDLGRLSHTPVAGWFLGHVHRPDPLDAPRAALAGAPLIGYLGSLVGLDAGEPGWHGAWEVRLTGPQAGSLSHPTTSPTPEPTTGGLYVRRVHLAPARWERLDVPVAMEPTESPGVATDPDAVLDAVRAAVTRAAADLVAAMPATTLVTTPAATLSGPLWPPPAVLWRVRLVSPPAAPPAPPTTDWSRRWAAIRQAIRQAIDALREDGRPSAAAYFEAAGLPCVIERLTDDTRPPKAALNLDALASQATPVGWLARQLLALEAPADPATSAPLPAALDALARQALEPLQASAWHPDEAPLAPPRDLLRAAAWRALEALLDTRQEAGR